MTREFDVIVVGTGPASAVATRLAGEGRSVAVVEAREPGGNCALRGCNPKKVLVEAAAAWQRARDADGRLLRVDRVAIDWPALMRFERSFVEPVTPGTIDKYRELGIALHRGRAAFVSPDTLTVGDERLRAEHIVLATGARPATLDVPGAGHVTTSDGFLELSSLPERILFVGGGYISLEFAHVAVRAGARVTVVDRGERPLKPFDPDLVDRLATFTRELGVDLRTSTQLSAVERTGAELEASFDRGPALRCDLVVHGAGRVPALDGLDLEAGGVEHGPGGVVVDEQLRSPSNPRVFAVGDCADSGDPALTPAANAHAHLVTRLLLGESVEGGPDTVGMPSVVFTVPALAAVGLGVAAARQQGLDVEVLEGDMSRWASVRKQGAGLAAYKILVERGSERLLGAHLLGPRAEETINLFALALRAGMTRRDLKAAPLAFPTFASDVRQMV